MLRGKLLMTSSCNASEIDERFVRKDDNKSLNLVSFPCYLNLRCYPATSLSEKLKLAVN